MEFVHYIIESMGMFYEIPFVELLDLPFRRPKMLLHFKCMIFHLYQTKLSVI